MKKYFALILLFFTVIACTGIEQVDPIDEPDGPKTYTMTVKAAKDVDTKALSLDGTKLNALWAENDAVIVVNSSNVEIGTLYAQDLSADGKSCTLKGRLDTAPADDETLTLKYHSDIYTGQDGTLGYIAGNCDYAEASVTVNVDSSTGDVTTTAPAAFVNKQAIVKFTFNDSVDPSTLLSPSVIEVEASLATFSEDYSFDIPSTTYTTNGPGIIYLAFPDVPADYASLKSSIAFNIKATVGANTYTFTKKGFPFENGKYFDITVKMAEVIGGLFTVNDSGKKVYFSKGNLQATTSDNGANWTWHFGPNQYARVGEGANKYINGNGSVSDAGNGLNIDLFGWSTSKTYLGINNDTNNEHYRESGVTDGTDFVDWGSAPDVTAGIGTGWRTLTSDEWRYLMVTRSGNRFALASINGSRGGIILLPDDWKTSYYSLSSINSDDVAFTVNTISPTDWTSKLEAHGAVFLPVTGQRNYDTNKECIINGMDDQLHYWSSTGGENASHVPTGNHLRYISTGLAPDAGAGRCNGYSVRLVRDAN